MPSVASVAFSSSAITPSIGARGSYTAAIPFAPLLNPLLEYTCIEIALLSALHNQDYDAFEEVYSPQGLTQTKFDADCASGVCLVLLQTGSGEIIRIPSNFLTGVPDPNGVRYSALMAGLYLGALPDTFDAQPLLEALSEVTLAYTGIDPQAKIINLQPEYLVSPETHATLQSARLVQIQSRETIIAQNDRLLEENTSLSSQVENLLGIISQLKSQAT